RRWSEWPGRSYSKAWMYFGASVLPSGLHRRARKAFGRDFEPKWLKSDILRDAGVEMSENRQPRTSDGKGRRVVERLAYEAQERVLPPLLRHGDRNAMRFSIEGRVPFLTAGMAE